MFVRKLVTDPAPRAGLADDVALLAQQIESHFDHAPRDLPALRQGARGWQCRARLQKAAADGMTQRLMNDPGLVNTGEIEGSGSGQVDGQGLFSAGHSGPVILSLSGPFQRQAVAASMLALAAIRLSGSLDATGSRDGSVEQPMFTVSSEVAVIVK